MQPAEQQKCQHHRAGPGKCTKPDQETPLVVKACCRRSTWCPGLRSSLRRRGYLSHHCFGDLWSWCNTHAHCICLRSLQFYILHLLKAPMVYINKAATGFYTLTAKSKVPCHTTYSPFFAREDGYTRTHTLLYKYRYNRHLPIYRTHLLRFCFPSQQHSSEHSIWPHAGMSQVHRA